MKDFAYMDRMLLNKLQLFKKSSIVIENRVHTFEEIFNLIRRAKVVLFTHKSRSVLSSGILMDTISVGGTVLVPHISAFKDMKEENLIHSYNGYNQLFYKLDSIIAEDENIDFSLKSKFASNNSWSSFANNVSLQIEGLFL